MQHTTELADRLAGIANELLQLAKELGNPEAREPEFPKEAVHRVVAGICLNCGKAKAEVKGKFRRGNCPSCSRKVNTALDKAPLRSQLERQFISEGLLTPEHFKIEPSRIDSVIAKVTAVADHHFADPAITPPGRKRRASKK